MPARTTFTEDERRILNARVFVHVATLMEDGSPHVSPMWVELDGDLIVLNTQEGRIKPENIRHDPRVSLSVIDPDNEYRNITVRGRVVEITQEGADEGIHRLARKYTGQDYRWLVPGKPRVQFKVQPEHIGGSTR